MDSLVIPTFSSARPGPRSAGAIGPEDLQKVLSNSVQRKAWDGGEPLGWGSGVLGV